MSIYWIIIGMCFLTNLFSAFAKPIDNDLLKLNARMIGCLSGSSYVGRNEPIRLQTNNFEEINFRNIVLMREGFSCGELVPNSRASINSLFTFIMRRPNTMDDHILCTVDAKGNSSMCVNIQIDRSMLLNGMVYTDDPNIVIGHIPQYTRYNTSFAIGTWNIHIGRQPTILGSIDFSDRMSRYETGIYDNGKYYMLISKESDYTANLLIFDTKNNSHTINILTPQISSFSNLLNYNNTLIGWCVQKLDPDRNWRLCIINKNDFTIKFSNFTIRQQWNNDAIIGNHMYSLVSMPRLSQIWIKIDLRSPELTVLSTKQVRYLSITILNRIDEYSKLARLAVVYL
jgi:hypothetical protein